MVFRLVSSKQIGALLDHTLSEVQTFFRLAVMPRTSNDTLIRFIPKILSTKKVSDYKPIALCNVCYKMISKILSIRLQPFLNLIILENQSAFVPKRAIADNVLITHEVLHYLKTLRLWYPLLWQ